MFTPIRTRTLVAILAILAIGLTVGLALVYANNTNKSWPEALFGGFPVQEQTVGPRLVAAPVTAEAPAEPTTVVDTQPFVEPVCGEGEELGKNNECLPNPATVVLDDFVPHAPIPDLPVVGTVEDEVAKTNAGHMSGTPTVVEEQPVVVVEEQPVVTPEEPVVEDPCFRQDPECYGEPILEEPVCGEGEEFQGEFGCVAVQLPEEQIGRQFDGENGQICTVVAVDPYAVECVDPVVG